MSDRIENPEPWASKIVCRYKEAPVAKHYLRVGEDLILIAEINRVRSQIATLQAELETMREERDAYKTEYEGACVDADELVERLENERPTNMASVLALHLKAASLIQSQATALAAKDAELERLRQNEKDYETAYSAGVEWMTRAKRAEAKLASGEVTEVTHRHKKRGTEYVLIGIGKMQCDWWEHTGINRYPVDMREVAIYRSVDDGSLWVRPREEFEDGRFEDLRGDAS